MTSQNIASLYLGTERTKRRKAATSLLKLERLGPGRYAYRMLAVVEKTDSGWRWHAVTDPSVGGEWRGSRREACADLSAWLAARSGRR